MDKDDQSEGMGDSSGTGAEERGLGGMPSGVAAATGRGTSIYLSMHPNVKAEQLHQALDRILNLRGCRGCGLQGFDLHLYGGDPQTDAIKNLPGVQGGFVGH